MIKKNNLIIKFILLLYIFVATNNSVKAGNEIKIITKINNEIITNHDIKQEYKFLVTLNSNLKKFEKNELFKLAEKTIINEIIKKNELKKFFNLEEENNYVTNIFEQFYKDRNFNTADEFKKYLNQNGLDIETVKSKIKIESLWNQYIFEKFRNKIVVNETKINLKISNITKLNQEENVYELLEILFYADNKEIYEEKSKKIAESIKVVGFQETAIIYSETDSAKNSGYLGWINESILSEKINSEIKKIKIKEIIKPIKVVNGFLVLKLNDKKKQKREFDKKKMFIDLVEKEKNDLLNQYSLTYFNRLKKNNTIIRYE